MRSHTVPRQEGKFMTDWGKVFLTAFNHSYRQCLGDKYRNQCSKEILRDLICQVLARFRQKNEIGLLVWNQEYASPDLGRTFRTLENRFEKTEARISFWFGGTQREWDNSEHSGAAIAYSATRWAEWSKQCSLYSIIELPWRGLKGWICAFANKNILFLPNWAIFGKSSDMTTRVAFSFEEENERTVFA